MFEALLQKLARGLDALGIHSMPIKLHGRKPSVITNSPGMA
jgi:hypothetical protein